MKKPLLLGLLILIPVALFAVFYSGRQYEQPDAEPGSGPKTPLIDRAITALGGADALSKIRSLTSETHGIEAGRESVTRVRILLPNKYRHDLETQDATLVHATDGKAPWSTLDGTLMPLNDDDRNRFVDQVLLVRCGLLVGLKEDKDVEISELGMRDDLEWLQVEFKQQSGGPFLLGFDSKSALLKRAEWDSRLSRNLAKTTMSVAFDDYRLTGEVMVAYKATISMEGHVAASDIIESITLNSELSDDIFIAPASASVTEDAGTPQPGPIMARTTRARTALVVSAELGEDDGSAAESSLDELLDELKLSRIGPTFHDVLNERVICAGIPIGRTGDDSSNPPELPSMTGAAAKGKAIQGQYQIPSRSVLSTVVLAADEETLKAAHLRLTTEAQSQGLKASPPFRHVFWKEATIQVQLPVSGN